MNPTRIQAIKTAILADPAMVAAMHLGYDGITNSQEMSDIIGAI